VGDTVTLTIHAPLRRTDLPGLIARTCTLFGRGGFDVLHCEVAGVAADAVAVDVLARLALLARREGCAVRLCGASAPLRALVAFVGLAEVLPALTLEVDLGLEPSRQAKEREDPLG
jgi:ABC-type transporter Mla MlaB component